MLQRTRKKRRTIFLSGASGFVGRALSHSLSQQGHTVHSPKHHRPSSTGVIEHSINSESSQELCELFLSIGVDTLVHCGISRRETAIQNTINNVSTTLSLLEAAKNAAVSSLVFCSSSTAYELCDGPMTEELPLRPHSLYGADRAACDHLARCYATQEGLRLSLLRIFSVYGPGEPGHRFIPKLFQALIQQRPLQVTEYHAARDLVYIDDVVRALELAMSAPQSSIFNVCSGVETSNEGIINEVEHIVGRKLLREPVIYPQHHTDRPHWHGSYSKIESELQWHPTQTLSGGLRSYYQWLLKRGKGA